MNDEELIDRLVGELRPVQRLPSASRRAAAWMVVAIAYVVALSVALGL